MYPGKADDSLFGIFSQADRFTFKVNFRLHLIAEVIQHMRIHL